MTVGIVDNLVTGGTNLEKKLDIFESVEILFRESPDLLKELPACHQRSAGDRLEFHRDVGSRVIRNAEAMAMFGVSVKGIEDDAGMLNRVVFVKKL